MKMNDFGKNFPWFHTQSSSCDVNVPRDPRNPF